MAKSLPSRKRHWKRWALSYLTRPNLSAAATTARSPLMLPVGKCCSRLQAAWLDLEEEAEYGNRKYLEKQDFILAKQKEQLAAQQSKLDELTLKVNDMETLIDEVSAAAYDKAVEVVTDVVRTETRKEDMRMIEDTKKWVLSPERKAAQSTREYAAHRLDDVLNKFLKTMQTTATRLQDKLLKPEVRQKGKEQVKEKARDSVLQLLNRLQAEQIQRKPSVPPVAEKSETRGDVY